MVRETFQIYRDEAGYHGQAKEIGTARLTRIGTVRAVCRGRRSCRERSHGDLLDHAPDRPEINQSLSDEVGYVEACARSFYYSHAHRYRPRDRRTAPNRSRR